MAARNILKKTTGLTGLPVCEHPHHVLTVIYGKVLKALERIPSDAAYRKNTEKIINERLQHVKAEPDVPKLEQKIGMGQIEEVIVQAENELRLARNFAAYKPWEPLIGKPSEDQWRWPI